MIIENGVLKGVFDSDIINGKLEIPESVTGIGESAFWHCTSLEEIQIPESVTSIGKEAFIGCESLSKIQIPESVTSIGEAAFKNCKSVKEIQIPESVTSIGEEAFSKCEGLEKIQISENVTSIGERTFQFCKSLKEIQIPESVTSIGKEAFIGCESLKEIQIPKSVTSIGNLAFDDCTSLEEIQIPESVTSIGETAFGNCKSLKEIQIPESVTSIGFQAFIGCESLEEIQIPESVTSIGERAFQYCKSLNEIQIPESVTSIDERAFGHCTSLKEIQIPESVTSIGENLFEDCIKLQRIIMSNNISDQVLETLYREEMPIDQTLMFGEDLERFETLKERNKVYLEQDSDYGEKQMDIFYHRMIKSIGIEETEKIFEIPNLKEKDIKKYMTEKNEVFQSLYDLKFQAQGDLGVTLEIFKALNRELQMYKKDEQNKNSAEMKIFKELNKILEEDTQRYSLKDLVKMSMERAGYEIDLDNIEKIEEEINAKIIKINLEKIAETVEEKLAENTGDEIGIVRAQVKPVRIMIESAIKDLIKEQGEVTKENLAEKLAEKTGEAHSHYVRQNQDKIISKMLDLLEDEEVSNLLNHTAVTALKETKKQIGGAWKYKINQALVELGYTFDNLPNGLAEDEIAKLKAKLNIEIETTSIAELKEDADREEAYELLRKYGDVVTYKQIHDMFGSVQEPYSEEFMDFFKKHKEEFLSNPEYYMEFGRIHNHFKRIVNSRELKNIYKSGKLELSDIMGYLLNSKFANTREGNEELARLASSVGGITTEEEFEYVQDVFEITKRRERSSIPPIRVKSGKYEGRMLEPDDALNLFAGNITTCCQKFGDIGEASMLLGSIEENAGIFVVEEIGENGERNIVAQSLTIRQKGKDGARDRLCFDNIEIPQEILEEIPKEDHKEILELYKQAGKQAIEIDKKFLRKLQKEGKITQEQYDRFVLKEVIAGTGYNDLEGLDDLPEAETVVADEAYYQYKTKQGYMYPWIDSTKGEAPFGSPGKPVILTEMPEEERKEILKRQKENSNQNNIQEIPLWYKNVKDPTIYTATNISENEIDLIRKLERQAYREEQQIINDRVQDMEDIEDIYDIEDAKIVIGSNKDWYLIYGENEDGNIEISDLAIVGAMNAETSSKESQGNVKLATAESTDTLYKLLIEAGEKGEMIHCDATRDTSLINIKRMLRKGLVKIYDDDENEISYDKEKGLIYADNKEEIQYDYFSNNEDIEMFGVYIEPQVEAIKEEEKKIQELLNRVKETEKLRGKEKEEGLDELRKTMRKGEKTNDER